MAFNLHSKQTDQIKEEDKNVSTFLEILKMLLILFVFENSHLKDYLPFQKQLA